MDRFKEVFLCGLLALTIGIEVMIVLVSFFELAAAGESSSPQALSNLINVALLPIVPGMYAYPNRNLALAGVAVGFAGGLYMTLEYYAGNSHRYVEVVATLFAAVGWENIFFYLLLAAIVAFISTTFGWHINYGLMSVAKRTEKDWP